MRQILSVGLFALAAPAAAVSANMVTVIGPGGQVGGTFSEISAAMAAIEALNDPSNAYSVFASSGCYGGFEALENASFRGAVRPA